MDINVHRFGFPAKRGLYHLQEKFKDIVFEVLRCRWCGELMMDVCATVGGGVCLHLSMHGRTLPPH